MREIVGVYIYFLYVQLFHNTILFCYLFFVICTCYRFPNGNTKHKSRNRCVRSLGRIKREIVPKLALKPEKRSQKGSVCSTSFDHQLTSLPLKSRHLDDTILMEVL